MIPFNPTPDRIFEGLRDLRFERRDERGYKVVVGYPLYCEMVREAGSWGWIGPPDKRTVFGRPVEVDETMPRGWIALRHEVIR